MADTKWPEVGQGAKSMNAHAANLKVDIAKLQDRIEGGDHVPTEVFRQFSLSVEGLLDKVLGRPDIRDLQASTTRCQENTDKTLMRASKSQTSSAASHHTGSPLQSKLPFASIEAKFQRSALQSSTRITLPIGPSAHDGPLYDVSLGETSNAIRLLRIDARSELEPDICGHLMVVPFGSSTPPQTYKALSYTWGDSADTVPIILNDRTVYITRNLKEALQCLRNLQIAVPVWVDAVCINQADDAERTTQVQLMRQIYQTADEVIVYLGHAEPFEQGPPVYWTGDEHDMTRIEPILEHAQRFAHGYPLQIQELKDSEVTLAFCFLRLMAGDVHLRDNPLLKGKHVLNACIDGIEGLMKQPWWDRIWTTQEVILPAVVTVAYGSHAAPLFMLTDAADQLRVHEENCCAGYWHHSHGQRRSLDKFVSALSTIYQNRKSWRETSDLRLTTLLHSYFMKRATDPRDKIYGLLGLVSKWGQSDPVVPNYNITPRQLFERVAHHWIDIDSNLEFLYFRSEHMIAKSDLSSQNKSSGQIQFTQSSWAPDWSNLSGSYSIQAIVDRIGRARVFAADRCASATPHTRQYLVTVSPVMTEASVLPVASYPVGHVQDRTEWLAKGKDIRGLKITPNKNSSFDLLGDELFQRQFPDRPREYLRDQYSGPTSELKYNKYTNEIGTRYDALCRAMIADSMINHESTSAGSKEISSFRRATQEDVESVQLWRNWLSRERKSSIDGHAPPTTHEFADKKTFDRVLAADGAVRSALTDRRVVYLDTGHVGIAPRFAQPRDVVMVFEGATTPFMVRALGSVEIQGLPNVNDCPLGPQQIWAVVGECYIIGIMDGEVIDYYRRAGKDSETIYLV